MNPSTVQIEARYKPLWRQPDLLEAEHGDGNHEGQRQFEPQKVRFVAGLKDLSQQAAMEVSPRSAAGH